MQYPSYQEAGWPIGGGECRKCQQAGRGSTAERSGHAASSSRMSIPCWCCAMRSAIGDGRSRGRPREESDKPGALVNGMQTESLGWPVLFGPSSSGECGSIGSLTRLFRFPPKLGLRPCPSLQFVVLELVIPGVSLFSDGLLPAWCLQKRSVQKNEPHPTASFSLTFGKSVGILLAI